jgi:3-deoxy-D-manno-octulosonic-acid transferase
VKGRKGLFEKLEAAFARHEKVIWIHCASLGEFEQGRPLLEKFKSQHSNYKVLLTFFSPSGYEIRKNYEGADWVFYLPMDGKRNATRFLKIVKPSLVIFIKYEFWYYYLTQTKKQNIPLLLVSAIFREDMHFFKWYGGFARKMLGCFSHFFVQNEESKKHLEGIGLKNTDVTGDTRCDRVIKIAEKAESIPIIEQFTGNNKIIVAGSTWPEDEVILQKALSAINDPSLKLIIAPHEINEKHLSDIEKLFPGSVRFSHLTANGSQFPPCLIIDNIGLLSRLYKYGYITYVGGGFNKSGIHNILEAAVYGKPVLFGPYYHKFKEAVDLVKMGGSFCISNTNNTIAIFQQLLNNEDEYLKSSESSLRYVYANKGATEKILEFIYRNRLLIN